MEAQSKRQEETKNINLSLHTFGKVLSSHCITCYSVVTAIGGNGTHY